MSPSVSVIVPFRDKGDPDRAANLKTVLAHLARVNVGPVHVVSDETEGPFNRSRAFNLGRQRFPADVYIWHEADMVIPPAQLAAAVQYAETTPGLLIPFLTYKGLSRQSTLMVRAGADPRTQQPAQVMLDGHSIGAVGVTSEATMAAVGQWDECFAGWGHDDVAMLHAFGITSGKPHWIDGDGFHLWHTPGAEAANAAEEAATAANLARCAWYETASDPELIRAKTCEQPQFVA